MTNRLRPDLVSVRAFSLTALSLIALSASVWLFPLALAPIVDGN